MPRYSLSGIWASGVGGVYLSIAGRQALNHPSSCIGWITPTEVASNVGGYTRIMAVQADDPSRQRLLYEGPSEATRVGGGRWAVRIPNGPWLLDTGQTTQLAVEGFGEDGCLVTWSWEGGGLIVGDRKITDEYVSGVRVFTKDCFHYQTRGGVIHVVGIPPIVTLPGVAQNLRMFPHGGDWWCLYQSTHTGTLVVHPINSLVGAHLTRPGDNAFRPDLISAGGKLKACWAQQESELHNEVNEAADITSLHLIDLHGQAQPTPTPTPSPEPAPMPEVLADPPKKRNVVDSEWQKQPADGSPDGNYEFCRRVVRTLRQEDKRWGLNWKRARVGSPSRDVVSYRWGPTDSDCRTVDVLSHSDDPQNVGPAWHVHPQGPGALWFWDEPDGQPVPQPPSAGTHKYQGGGNDSGKCDECKRLRLDPVHEVPEGKVPHAYWGGEDGVGLCDICLMYPEDAPIHAEQPAPVPVPTPAPQPPAPVPAPPADDEDDDSYEANVLAFFDLMIEEQINTNQHLAEIKDEIIGLRADVKAAAAALSKVLGGGWGSIFRK